MRQKKLKHVNTELLQSYGVLTSLASFSYPSGHIHVEIGSGKGQFISKLAQDYPNGTFIAIEVNSSVLYRIVEKKNALGLDNLYICLGEANQLIADIPDGQIDQIYLNFSDPWPKKRHHKRRLTYLSFLENYVRILKSGGYLQFRTDHQSFFEDSVSYIETVFAVKEVNTNLSASRYMTEYEERKREIGPIFQLIGEKK